MRPLSAFVALMMLAAAPFAAAEDRVRAGNRVIVRVYDMFGLPPADVRAARHVADTILGRAGILVSWRECAAPTAQPGPARDNCDSALSPREMMVRIVASTPAAAILSEGTLGFSYVDDQTRSGVLATIFADRINALTAHLHRDRGTLLGRAFAHELGHLLLGTATHAASGLMRAHWSEEELRRDLPRDWVFQQMEAAAMRSNLMRGGRMIEAPAAVAADVLERPRRGETMIE